MSVDLELAEQICDLMNELIAIDRPAVAAMLANRTPCNKALADHSTVQVASRHGGYDVGILGILNGLCGIHEDGNGAICAVFDDPKTDRGFHDLSHFAATKQSLESPAGNSA